MLRFIFTNDETRKISLRLIFTDSKYTVLATNAPRLIFKDSKYTVLAINAVINFLSNTYNAAFFISQLVKFSVFMHSETTSKTFEHLLVNLCIISAYAKIQTKTGHCISTCLPCDFVYNKLLTTLHNVYGNKSTKNENKK